MNRIERTGRNAERIEELRRLSPLGFCPNCHMVMGIEEAFVSNSHLRCGNCGNVENIRRVTPEEAYVILDTDLLAVFSTSLKIQEIGEPPYMWE